jgi:glycosyltransferase involved in cell wall biosynthesis
MPKISIITVTRSRPQQLAKAMDSLREQSSSDFEWIVINDGEDPATEELISKSSPNFPISYNNMPHPNRGFGLCYGRNRGLILADGEIVTYLDDDNTFKPNFVAETIAFFEAHPQVSYSMPVQQRRRDVIEAGVVVKQGKEFFSPSLNCSNGLPSATAIEELINHQQLIDSNGFCHRANARLNWNPDLRIYIDYEFLLRCVALWGREKFAINPVMLVDYIQTNQGIIGQSNYQDWAEELGWIIEHHHSYPCLNEWDILALNLLKDKYLSRHQDVQQIAAFTNRSEMLK